MNCLGLRVGASVLLAKPPSNLLGRVCVHGALQPLWCQLHFNITAGTASTHSGRGTRTGMQEIGLWLPRPLGPLLPLVYLQTHFVEEGSELSARRPQDSHRDLAKEWGVPAKAVTYRCALHQGLWPRPQVTAEIQQALCPPWCRAVAAQSKKCCFLICMKTGSGLVGALIPDIPGREKAPPLPQPSLQQSQTRAHQSCSWLM